MNAMQRTVMAAVVAGVFESVWANPTTPTVVSGAALMSNPSASVMQVVNTPGTIINWQGFSIANGETTRFVQLNAASAVLNRVTGGNPSTLLGRLESNGRVFLVNTNGIVFGGGSVVDVAGLIASTRDIVDANFLAGNYLFNGFSNAAITVQNGAQILTSTYGPGGQVWLFAKNVTQEAGSSMTAPQGQVVLAAGTELQVATNGLGQMSFAVTTDGTSTVDSLGTIAADRGAVGLFADFINHRGSVNAGNRGTVAMDATNALRIQGASEINAPDGNITLRGGSVLEVEHDSVIDADGVNGKISFESNNLLVYPSGNVHAVGGQVTFNQYQPSQYIAGSEQHPWATPAGFTDDNIIIFRRGDGNYAVRFSRRDNTDGAVEAMEVVLDGRSHAILSGPTVVNTALGIAFNTASTNASDQRRAADDNYNNVLYPAFVSASSAAFDAYNADPSVVSANARLYDATISPTYAEMDAWVTAGGGRTSLDIQMGFVVADFLLAKTAPIGSADYARIFGNGTPQPLAQRMEQVFGSSALPAKYLTWVADTAAATATRDSAIDAARTTRDNGEAAGLAAANAAQAVADAARAAYYAALPGGAPVFYATASTPDVTPAAVPTSAGGSIGGGGIAPLADGSYIDYNVGQTLNLPNGAQSAMSPAFPANGREAVFAPNALGGFSVGATTFGAQRGGSLRTYTKVVPPYIPASLATGAVGDAVAFATAPGVATDPGAGSSPTPPSGGGTSPAPAPGPQPTAAGGAGSGAGFAGVSGCNSAVCATEVRDVLAITDAMRTSQNVSASVQGGRIGDRDAAAAVAALERAQAGGNSAAARAQDEAIVIRDHGEMGRLIADITNSLGNMTPAEVRQQAALLNTIVSDFMERELITQQLGLSRANPDAMDLVGALQNMNAEERAAFGMAIRNSQASGQP